ncbi:MarR family winged helix-turn-helix transcriptional regulator [Cloacibacillus sp. An23]|uniref:MarR family winged helix-turn-helix transcriptional regulator n=1 Tax=Cloacibacillus sp. An23 TaxID=1965591 RepID=UPI000B37E7B3|nr:MarR family winged helix-turn-helix transcriptional regulator [Cloacibacillus sp. An23]OUO93265.1 hypothetical protein B5F39_08165 [Cloacibacillus sp. An23]
MADGYDLVRRLGMAAVKMDGAYYKCAKKLGINENMLDLLYALDDGAPHTQKQVCGDWLIPKTTVNTNVRELVASGRAELLPAEGREKTIRLTDEGRRFADEVMRGVHMAEEAALAKTVERFSAEFISALEYFADCYGAEVERLAERSGKERPR